MINVVFVGCGAALELLYRTPLRAMERRGWLHVCGLVDTSDQRLQSAAAWFRHPRVFKDLAAALDTLGSTDLVIIASPPAFHAAHAAIAFERHCHVLCEKPMAHSIDAAVQMVAMAHKYNCLLSIGMARRFYPAVEVARSWIKENTGPFRFAYREGSTFDWPVASPMQFRRSTGGGGVLIDKGVHALDILCHLFGHGRLLRSADDGSRGEGVESNSVMELAFEEARGFMHISWETPLNNGFHIAAEEEELWLPLSPVDTIWNRGRTVCSAWKKIDATIAWPASLAETKPALAAPKTLFDCVHLQLISVLRSILFGQRPMTSGEDGLEVLRLLMAAYDQATPLRQPWLPKAEQHLMAATHWRASAPVAAK